MTNVAVIGAGLIGRAWSIVFARAGFQVALWDQFPLQVTQARCGLFPIGCRSCGPRGCSPTNRPRRSGAHPADAVHVGNRTRGRIHPGDAGRSAWT